MNEMPIPVLSQIDYLRKKLADVERAILKGESSEHGTTDDIKELYFQKGKLFSELELMKRVPQYTE